MADSATRLREGMYFDRRSSGVYLVEVYRVLQDAMGDPAGALGWMAQQFPIGSPYPGEPFAADGAKVDGHRFLRQITPNSYRIAVIWLYRANLTLFPRRRRWRSDEYPDPNFTVPVVKKAVPPPGDTNGPPPRDIWTTAYIIGERMIGIRYEFHTIAASDENAVSAALHGFRGRMFWFGTNAAEQSGWYLLMGAGTYSTESGNLNVTYKFMTKSAVPAYPADDPDTGVSLPSLNALDEYGALTYSQSGAPSIPRWAAEDHYGPALKPGQNNLPGAW